MGNAFTFSNLIIISKDEGDVIIGIIHNNKHFPARWSLKGGALQFFGIPGKSNADTAGLDKPAEMPDVIVRRFILNGSHPASIMMGASQ